MTHRYFRTVEQGQTKGWIGVCNDPQNNALTVTFFHNPVTILPLILCRLRNLFDLSVSPLIISKQLQEDPLFKATIAKWP